MNVEEGESPNVINISLSGQREKYTGIGSQGRQSGGNASGTTLDESIKATIVLL